MSPRQMLQGSAAPATSTESDGLRPGPAAVRVTQEDGRIRDMISPVASHTQVAAKPGKFGWLDDVRKSLAMTILPDPETLHTQKWRSHVILKTKPAAELSATGRWA
jgi:hypothetical protein